jgi:hypothetical protein
MGEMFASGARIVIQPLHQLTIPSKNNKSFWSKTYFLVRVLGLLKINPILCRSLCKKKILKNMQGCRKRNYKTFLLISHSSIIYYKEKLVVLNWVRDPSIGIIHQRYITQVFMSLLYRINELEIIAQGRQRVIRRESKTDSYSKGPNLFGLRCILCHNFWTNYDLDLFSTSKWPSDLQFCERYRGRCQKND